MAALHHSRPDDQRFSAHDATAKSRIAEAYGTLPLGFEENGGQTASEVKFLSRGAGYTLFLTSNEAVLTLRKAPQETKRLGIRADAPGESAQSAGAIVRMKLVGGASASRVSGQDELRDKSNYLTGPDPQKWRTGIRRYRKVEYENVYPGVNLVYYGNQRQLEYDFIVAPGADPRRIRLGFDGTQKIRVGNDGGLVLQTAGGQIQLRKPVVYQDIDGRRQPIPGGYVLTGHHDVAFRLGSYDTTKPLVVDPVLVYSTYLAGSTADAAFGIAVDSDGHAYVVGNTASTNFPVAGSVVQPACATIVVRDSIWCDDVFVTKLSADGTTLEYSTYLGGTSSDSGNGIAVDGSGNAYIVGTTYSADFPTMNPVQAHFRSDPDYAPDAFVAKLSADGSALLYSTYLGGRGGDYGNAIAVDAAGAAYVAGMTDSIDFPIANPVQPDQRGIFNAFVAKLTSDGLTLAYSTYLGGDYYDSANGIVVSDEGYASIVGETQSPDFPTFNASQPTYGESSDAFVATLAADGSTLLYSSYLGGAGYDVGTGIAIANQSYYVTGGTSGDFPGANATPFGGDLDTFVAIIGFDGVMRYSRYLGGSDMDSGSAIAVDPAGNVFIAGVTRSPDFPTLNALQGPAGDFDVFLSKLNPSNALVFSTYLGGQGYEPGSPRGPALAVDASGNAYLAGITGSSDFPTTPNALQPAWNGNGAAFVAKIFDDGAPVAPVATADLSIVEVQGPPTEGEERFLFSIRNNGPSAASGVRLTDTLLPGGVAVNFALFYTSEGVSGSCDHESGVLTCNLIGLPVGGIAQVGISLTSGPNGTLINTATVTATERDPNLSDNTITSTRLIADPSIIGFTEEHGPDLFYWFGVGNNGPGVAQNVRFTDRLPAGVIVKTAGFWLEAQPSTPFQNCPNDNGVITCSVGSLTPGLNSRAIVLITVTPPGPGTLINTATIVSGGSDYDISNNSLTLTTAFAERHADLSVAQSRAPAVATLGSTLTYTLDVTNNGPSEATGVHLTDALSSGETLVSVTASQGSCGGGPAIVGCDVGTMAVGAVVRATLVVRATGIGPLSNSTTVNTQEVDDPRWDNNSATIVTPVNRLPIANAGLDQIVSAGSTCQAIVTLNGTGSSDPDGDPLTYAWTSGNLLPPPIILGQSGGVVTGPTPSGPLPLGTHTITLTVDDGRGGIATDAVVITVRDTAPPVFAGVSGPIVVEQTGPPGASIAVPLPTASDNCGGSVPVSSDAPAVFPRGTTRVTFTAVDASGNRANASTDVTVVDSIPPMLSVLSPQARDYAHSDVLVVTFTGSDAGSGLASGAPYATLDGAAVTNGQSIQLLTLVLGNHSLVVSGADVAGNSTSRTVTFRIIATIDSLIATVNVFAAQKMIDDAATVKGLLGKLDDAKQAANRGNKTVAINKLQDFINQVTAQNGKHITPGAAAILISDAQYVIGTLR